jgi:sugar transferase EpsL
MGRLSLKRLIDIAGAVLLLVLLAPLILLVTLLVRLTMGAPVLFRQERPGLHAKRFILYKFRTMSTARGTDGNPLPDEQRLTRLGRLMRATSLDELPELLNVLKGEMSLVGPRPLLTDYLVHYSPEQARRHEVRPGITGWAQVNGRNGLDWEEKFRLDVWYIDHWSLRLDFHILCMTLAQVFKREGISAPGHPTMPVFVGSQVREE